MALLTPQVSYTTTIAHCCLVSLPSGTWGQGDYGYNSGCFLQWHHFNFSMTFWAAAKTLDALLSALPPRKVERRIGSVFFLFPGGGALHMHAGDGPNKGLHTRSLISFPHFCWDPGAGPDLTWFFTESSLWSEFLLFAIGHVYSCSSDMQKFPLRMKDNDLLVTELYHDPSNDAITALSVYLTPKTSLYHLYFLSFLKWMWKPVSYCMKAVCALLSWA